MVAVRQEHLEPQLAGPSQARAGIPVMAGPPRVRQRYPARRRAGLHPAPALGDAFPPGHFLSIRRGHLVRRWRPVRRLWKAPLRHVRGEPDPPLRRARVRPDRGPLRAGSNPGPGSLRIDLSDHRSLARRVLLAGSARRGRHLGARGAVTTVRRTREVRPQLLTGPPTGGGPWMASRTPLIEVRFTSASSIGR